MIKKNEPTNYIVNIILFFNLKTKSKIFF